MTDFVVWRSKREPKGCSVVDLLNVDRVWALKDGQSGRETFPRDAAFRMDPSFKARTDLIDNIHNAEAMLVCSERLVRALQAFGTPKVEYLPVAVRNHRGRKVNEAYYIVHPIDPPDCIDLARSDVTWSGVDHESILVCRRLVIDDARIEPDRDLVRPKGLYLVHLIRRHVVRELAAQGFTGLAFIEVADYKS